MAAQPSFPREPSESDRLFGRLTNYLDARLDAITNQMRLGFAEAYTRDAEAFARDEALLKRIENLETTQKVVIDMQRDMVTTMQAIQTTMQTMQQHIDDGFAKQEERHNELMVRVNKIETQMKPPEA